MFKVTRFSVFPFFLIIFITFLVDFYVCSFLGNQWFQPLLCLYLVTVLSEQLFWFVSCFFIGLLQLTIAFICTGTVLPLFVQLVAIACIGRLSRPFFYSKRVPAVSLLGLSIFFDQYILNPYFFHIVSSEIGYVFLTIFVNMVLLLVML